MEKLLPIPTINHIPQYERAENLCNKMDEIFLGVQNDIISLKNILDPFACPAKNLDIFARYLSAYTEPTDSEDIKRHRIAQAIENNKLFGTWIQAKHFIDSICGGNAKLVLSIPEDGWFLCGDGAQADNQALPTWAIFGVNEQSAIDDKYGIALDGTQDIWQRGIYNIDVDNDHLSQEEIDLLYKNLFPTTPVGMTITVGYMSGAELVPYFILGETI